MSTRENIRLIARTPFTQLFPMMSSAEIANTYLLNKMAASTSTKSYSGLVFHCRLMNCHL